LQRRILRSGGIIYDADGLLSDINHLLDRVREAKGPRLRSREVPGMFEQLGRKLEGAFKRLTGQHQITEDNIKEALREVRLGLLEADVHFKVVKDFIQSVQQRALGQEVIRGVNPAQQFIHVVYLELIRMLGGTIKETPAEGSASDGAAASPEGSAETAPSPPVLPAPGSIQIEIERPFLVQPGKSNLILMLGLQGSGRRRFAASWRSAW